MALGTNQMTITTHTQFIPELWVDKIISQVESNLVLKPLTWDWSEPGQTKGNKIDVPNVTNITANVKAVNTQVTLNANTEVKSQLSISTHEECSFLLEDMAKIQASYNLMKYYTEKAAYAIAKVRDTDIATQIASFTQIVGSAGVDLGDVQIRNAIQFLDLGDVPQDERSLCIYPTQKNALMGIEKYYRADIRGDGSSPVVKGRMGEIYNIPIAISTNLGTSASARLNVMMHRQAIATADQEAPRTQSDYIIEYLGELVCVDTVYGQLLARNTFGVWMQS